MLNQRAEELINKIIANDTEEVHSDLRTNMRKERQCGVIPLYQPKIQAH
jgi:hypothetical protein